MGHDIPEGLKAHINLPINNIHSAYTYVTGDFFFFFHFKLCIVLEAFCVAIYAGRNDILIFVSTLLFCKG